MTSSSCHKNGLCSPVEWGKRELLLAEMVAGCGKTWSCLRRKERELGKLEQRVLVFPSASKWQADKPLSPCVCPACRQGNYDVEMLDRYQQALETAVNLSVKHSLPPLPGRTLLVYLTDADADRLCPKSNRQGVKNQKAFSWGLVGCWGSRQVS